MPFIREMKLRFDDRNKSDELVGGGGGEGEEEWGTTLTGRK